MAERDRAYADADRYRFALDDGRWIPFLEEHGFVVVKAVVGDCAPYVDGLWGSLEALSEGRLRRDERKTLATEANWPFLLRGGMVQYLGHTQAQWALRERCAAAFARRFGCGEGELATSYDGFCLMSGERSYAPRDPLSFVHTDQSPLREGFWSTQGLVNLVDNDESAGGLVVIPKSHLRHRDFLLGLGKTPKGDWYAFSEQEKKDPLFSTYVKVCGEAGDLFLFDSRTFHCNTVPERRVDRLCAYICMLPKERVPSFAVHKRRSALSRRRCSSHHPGDGFREFPAVPRFATEAQRRVITAHLGELSPGPEGRLQQSLAHAG